MNFYKAPQGWIRTAAALSQKTAQKQPGGLFLAARLAQSTRAHKKTVSVEIRRRFSVCRRFGFLCGRIRTSGLWFWKPALCQNELRRHEKSAPAQVGKDAGDIGVLLPHFFVDRAFVANLMSFIPPAGWGLFRRQHQAVISDVRNIPAKAVCDFVVKNRAENLRVRNRSCIKSHAVSSPRRFVFRHRLASLPYR